MLLPKFCAAAAAGLLASSASEAAVPAILDPPAASILVDPGRASSRRAERLEELGALDGYLPAQRAVPLSVIRAVFEGARQRGPSTDYAMRVAEEFRHHQLGAFALTELTAAGAASAVRRGQSIADPIRPPTLELPASHRDVGGFVRFSADLTRHLAFGAVPAFSEGQFTLSRWEVLGGFDRVTLSVGRATVGYGFGRTGGILFSGRLPLERIELQSSAPIWIHAAGKPLLPLAFHVFLSQLREERHPRLPFLLGMSLSTKPHPRLTLSAQRAVMVGPGNVGRELTTGDVLVSLTGIRNTGENNLLSAAFRFRMPTEEILPITLYGEWGTDDSAGGHYEAPGIVAGLRVPAVPGAPELLLGVEFAYFGVMCCRYRGPDTGWYAHFNHIGGWTSQDRPLGHPLGGDGREFRVYADSDLLDARLRIEFDAFVRRRDEMNLYGPRLTGNSAGAELGISWRVHPRIEIGIEGSYERAEAWWFSEGNSVVTLFF